MSLWNLIVGATLVALGGCQGGCAPAFPPEMRAAATAVVQSITDQAVWQNVTANVNGQVINPGIKGYAGMIYVAGGELTGVSGQVGIGGTGIGSGAATPEGRAAVRAILSEKGVPQQVIEAVLRALERGPAPVTP